ncbi:MAG: hypothetical protein AAFR39_09740 [Pseudomonadota bacterium]
MTHIDQAAINKALAIIRNFKSDWPGKVVDKTGLVHIANEDGRNTPLLWCFNDTHPFERLAEALGPDQPLIGLRSAHLTRRAQFRSTHIDFAIADRYTDLIVKNFAGSPLFVGGNCQGANIAARIKENLFLKGFDIPAAFQMESCDLQPFAGRQTMLFGEQSHGYNPYLLGKDPKPTWQVIFKEPSVAFLNGGHGEYFSPEGARQLADILLAKMSEAEPSFEAARQIDLVADFSVLTDVLQPGQPVRIKIDLRAEALNKVSALSALKLYAFWYSIDRLWAETELVDLDCKALNSPKEIHLTAPEKGGWNLTLYPAIKGHGPVSVGEARKRTQELTVGEAS